MVVLFGCLLSLRISFNFPGCGGGGWGGGGGGGDHATRLSVDLAL